MKFGLKILLTILITSYSSIIMCQEISLFGGINYNVYHDFVDQSAHYNSMYIPGMGYSSGIGIDNLKIDWINFDFTLQLDRYNGELEIQYSGLGGGNSIKAKTDKLIISLGVFPLNLNLFNKINLDFGFEVSRLKIETYSGMIYGWTMNQQDLNSKLEDFYDHYSSNTFLGLKARLSYTFNLSEKITIAPLYSYYFGLSNEFIEPPNKTLSMRNYILISINRKI